MEWILTFLEFAQNTVVAFTPQIVPAILPNLASSQLVVLAALHFMEAKAYSTDQFTDKDGCLRHKL